MGTVTDGICLNLDGCPTVFSYLVLVILSPNMLTSVG